MYKRLILLLSAALVGAILAFFFAVPAQLHPIAFSASPTRATGSGLRSDAKPRLPRSIWLAKQSQAHASSPVALLSQASLQRRRVTMLRAVNLDLPAVAEQRQNQLRTADARAPEVSQVPVLLYHNLDPKSDGKSGPTISPAEFESQMNWLDDNGYRSITTADLADWLSGKGRLPAKPVLITFDDGYESNLLYAHPILKRHGLKATLFMITGATGEKIGDFQWLNDKQLKEMAASGIWEIQGHSHEGHTMVNGKPLMPTWTEAQDRADLAKMRDAFKADKLPTPLSFAHPYGAFNNTMIQALKAEGFQMAFTVDKGYVKQGDNPFTLHRWVIYPLTSTCRFGQLVNGHPEKYC